MAVLSRSHFLTILRNSLLKHSINVVYKWNHETTVWWEHYWNCFLFLKDFDLNIFKFSEVFEDPEHPCRTCECCETGFFKCHIKDCTKEPPPCGREHYEVVKDECCPQCSRMCDYIKNTTENCRTKKCEGIDAVAYYPDNKCCQECGCSWRGGIVPEGISRDTLTQILVSVVRLKFISLKYSFSLNGFLTEFDQNSITIRKWLSYQNYK